MINNHCHICTGRLLSVDQSAILTQVTSDCRPWKKRGHLAICRHCGTVQKHITYDWLQQADEIYRGYEIYAQGDGAEQPTFDSENGISVARSQRIVMWLDGLKVLLEQGKLLDIGCGNGAFLRSFGEAHLGWELTGLELDDRNKSIIEQIPNAKFCNDPLESLEEKYDLIILVHALEHIIKPISFLNTVATKLKPDGLLFIEVPDLEGSSFDLLIADHCTHFMQETLEAVVKSTGFEVVKPIQNFIPKELSLLVKSLFRVSTDDTSHGYNLPRNKRLFRLGEQTLFAHMSWLKAMREQWLGITGDVGIFGSSISATWLASELGRNVVFFVDEDDNRAGNTHMGLPILTVEEVPVDIKILMPLRGDIARSIVDRLPDAIKAQFILPEMEISLHE